MTKRTLLFSLAAMAFLGVVAIAQMTPWLQWTFLQQNIMDEIIGESSGENAWYAVMETGGYDKDRPASEYGPSSMFHETRFYLDKVKEYGMSGVELARYNSPSPSGSQATTWDAVKGELWETQPLRQKLASYRDMAAMLATGSATADVTAELVWVGQGRKEDLEGKDLKGKIAVTDGSTGLITSSGAVGVISMSSSRAYFDPLQLPWMSVGGGRGGAGTQATVKFGFQMPPREGDYLKKRLQAGQKITVHAQVVSESQPIDVQNLTWTIPGTDPAAGELIFSAHLYEGYVKQGGNDDISGCASLMETARVLNTLIKENRIPRPKRTIRFLIGPEISGTGMWVKDHKAIMDKTLCNINLDMVGEWLSKNQSFFCMIRTTYGNPHYINDVMENYYRFVGEGNRERIQNRTSAEVLLRRIVAPTGADEPFYYAIETHYGSSDHEVFNDWGVQVPGIMMIDWPDRWYHTSGDHADKTDPTQLKRVTVIGAAAAFTIANADDEMAVKIASETAANGAQRIGHQLARGIAEMDAATHATLADAYKAAREHIEAAVINERNTLDTVNELAVDKARVAGHVQALQKVIEQTGAAQIAAVDAHMRAAASRLKMAPAVLKPTELELKAAAMIPKQTPKVTANGYQGYSEFLPARTDLAKFRSLDTSELSRLVNGRQSLLDMKKMLEAQAQGMADLQLIIDYMDVLVKAGLVEMPSPPAKTSTAKK